jgi:hypothetical protein
VGEPRDLELGHGEPDDAGFRFVGVIKREIEIAAKVDSTSRVRVML